MAAVELDSRSRRHFGRVVTECDGFNLFVTSKSRSCNGRVADGSSGGKQRSRSVEREIVESVV